MDKNGSDKLPINIAIDGPSGAGKSTISREIAKKLKFIYVDTGALYRAIGLYTEYKSINSKEKDAVVLLLKEVKIELVFIGGEQRVLLQSEDVTNLIRTESVSMRASDVSAIKEVRDFLLNLQREIASKSNVIMDGRDIGTVILPNAQIKIFLTASDEDRAQRRYQEQLQRGMDVTYEQIFKSIRERDLQDSRRDVSPLRPASDAILIDTTGNTFEQSVECLLKVIQSKL